MLIQTVRLTPSHVDLGCLSECSLMNLFAGAYLDAIMAGTNQKFTAIRDAKGNRLYPGFYKTELQLPSSTYLNQFALGDEVTVGVSLKIFGGMIIDATFALGKAGELEEREEAWTPDRYVMLWGGALFVVEEGRLSTPQPSVPIAEYLQNMTKIKIPPKAIEEFTSIQSSGKILSSFSPNLYEVWETRYTPHAIRDYAPGHALMFSTFSKICSIGEFQFLRTSAHPKIPKRILSCVQPWSRMVYYLGNVYGEHDVIVRTSARLDKDERGKDAYEVSFVTELFEAYENTLVGLSYSRHGIILPEGNRQLRNDLERMVSSVHA